MSLFCQEIFARIIPPTKLYQTTEKTIQTIRQTNNQAEQNQRIRLNRLLWTFACLLNNIRIWILTKWWTRPARSGMSVTHLQIRFWDIGASRVQHINDELTSLQQIIAHELARADRDFSFLFAQRDTRQGVGSTHIQRQHCSWEIVHSQRQKDKLEEMETLQSRVHIITNHNYMVTFTCAHRVSR